MPRRRRDEEEEPLREPGGGDEGGGGERQPDGDNNNDRLDNNNDRLVRAMADGGAEVTGKSRLSRAVFTWFAPPEMFVEENPEVEAFKARIALHCVFFVCQHEICPRTLRHHLQGYFELRLSAGERIYLTTVKKRIFGDARCNVHFLRRLGSQEAAIAYCEKDDSHPENGLRIRIGDPCPYHKSDEFDAPKSMLPMVASVKNVIDSALRRGKNPMHEIFLGADAELAIRHPTGVKGMVTAYSARHRETQRSDRLEVDVVVLYGASGTGKSFNCDRLEKRLREAGITCQRIQAGHISQGNKIWADADLEGKKIEVIIIEECVHMLDEAFFLTLCDPYTPARMQIKNSPQGAFAEPVLILITHNDTPSQWFPRATGEKVTAIKRRLTTVNEFKSRSDSYTFVWDFNASTFEWLADRQVNLCGISYRVRGAMHLIADDEATIAMPVELLSDY